MAQKKNKTTNQNRKIKKIQKIIKIDNIFI